MTISNVMILNSTTCKNLIDKELNFDKQNELCAGSKIKSSWKDTIPAYNVSHF